MFGVGFDAPDVNVWLFEIQSNYKVPVSEIAIRALMNKILGLFFGIVAFNVQNVFMQFICQLAARIALNHNYWSLFLVFEVMPKNIIVYFLLSAIDPGGNELLLVGMKWMDHLHFTVSHVEEKVLLKSLPRSFNSYLQESGLNMVHFASSELIDFSRLCLRKLL